MILNVCKHEKNQSALLTLAKVDMTDNFNQMRT